MTRQNILFSLLCLSLFFSSCKSENAGKAIEEVKQEADIIPVISLDKEALSGIGLKPVKNPNQPNRRLFQKRLIRGNEISVYIVSSETATAQQDNYAMEEFIYLINGRSRMNPVNGSEVIFETGDSFIAPKGFTGEWETLGGDEFLIELSVIATDRKDVQVVPEKTLPVLLDRQILSGSKITKNKEGTYSNNIFSGAELDVSIQGISPDSINVSAPMVEQLVKVISGKVTITPTHGSPTTFFTGDYYLLPSGFTGIFQSQAHGLFRTMHIMKAN